MRTHSTCHALRFMSHAEGRGIVAESDLFFPRAWYGVSGFIAARGGFMQEQISTLSPEDVRTLPKKPYAVWWYAFPIV